MSSKRAALEERLSGVNGVDEEVIDVVMEWHNEWSESGVSRTDENPMGWNPVNPASSTGNR